MKRKDIHSKRDNLEKKILKLNKILYAFMEIKY